MSVEQVYHCDWRECGGHARSAGDQPPSSFIAVSEEATAPHYFCTWDCLLKFAAERPPTEVVLSDAA